MSGPESGSLLAISIVPTLITVMFLIQLAVVIVTPIFAIFVGTLGGGEHAATASGLVGAASGIVSAASALAIGRVSDRFGHSRVMWACLLGSAISCLPQGAVQEVWQLLVLRMVMGVFLGGLMPTANALLVEAVPASRRGVAFGLATSATAVANAVGPVAGAAIAGSTGMRAIFPATGGLFAVALVWSAAGIRTRKPPRRSA